MSSTDSNDGTKADTMDVLSLQHSFKSQGARGCILFAYICTPIYNATCSMYYKNNSNSIPSYFARYCFIVGHYYLSDLSDDSRDSYSVYIICVSVCVSVCLCVCVCARVHVGQSTKSRKLVF